MNKIYVDKARLLWRVIIISWTSLILCFIIKIFGGNFFEIMCQSEAYKALCDYAERNLWFDFVLAISSSILCECLYLLAIVQRYKLKPIEFIIVVFVCIISWVFDIYLPKFSIITNIIMLFVLPICLLGKSYKKYWHILVAFALTFSFQFISLIVKNLAITQVDDSIFIVLIYGIDVYLMCFIYYLYRNFKKESDNMGRFWVLFMGKPIERLKKMKANREAKRAKLDEEIKAIEAEIERQKNEKK